jgi:hypothetical protein
MGWLHRRSVLSASASLHLARRDDLFAEVAQARVWHVEMPSRR